MGKGSRQGWAGLHRTCRPHIWARPGAALFPGEAALSLRGQWTSRQWEVAGWANMANPQCPQTTHILRFPFSTAPPQGDTPSVLQKVFAEHLLCARSVSGAGV